MPRVRRLGGAPQPGALALSLLLVAALMLLFVSRDLILFYVGFEAMLIPLAFQMGIWGGERRGRRRRASWSTRWPARS